MLNDKIKNDITEMVDKMLNTETVESYILKEVFKGAMAIRVPGLTIGEVKINDKFEVIGFKFYEDTLKYFKDKKFEQLRQFLGYKIEL